MPPQGAQTVEKPLNLEKAAFLASFGRSQRSWKMLRHKALGLCPKARQARRESACPVGTWAEGPKRRAARRREASALWAVARSAKRPGGVSKYKGCARPARRTPIFARAAKPCAHRREASAQWAVARSAKRPAGVSKYKGCARPARRTPIFAKGREARMIEQPGRPLHPALCRQTVPPQGGFFLCHLQHPIFTKPSCVERYDRYHKAAANKYA